MDEIKNLLSRITELTDDELNHLKDLILQQLDAQDSGSGDSSSDSSGGDASSGDRKDNPDLTSSATIEAADIETLEELHNAALAYKAEVARREDEAQRREEYSATLAEFKGTDQPAEDNSEEPESSDDTGEGEEAMAASGSPKVPDDNQPRKVGGAHTTVRAAGDVPGFHMGQEFSGPEELAQAMTQRIQTLRGLRGGDGERLIVASAELSGVPDELQLFSNDSESNYRKVMAQIAPSAIVAAGGIAAPEEVKYDLFGVGVSDRPVKAALPTFTATRGGVRFVTPPTLADFDGAVSIWTVSDDEDAVTDTNTRKKAFRVDAGAENTVDVDAIPLILTFGNMTARAYPELVARHNELGLIAHARIAERELLTRIGTLSTSLTGNTQKLSAAREVLVDVDKLASAYKSMHRTGPLPLHAIFPQWFLTELRADIAMQHPGDGLDSLAIADAQIQNWFKSRNINVTWALDGESGQDYSKLDDGSGGISDFPSNVIWYLYAEGTFAFLDGGTLDLGLVRDSTLNAANDYQMFVETFENVVKFGTESVKVTSALKPTGAGAADV